MKIFYPLFFIFWIFSIPLGATETFETYAGRDYADYLKSPFTNPAWDPFVKEGFEAMDRQDIQTSLEFLRKSVNAGCYSPLVFFKIALGYEAQGSYYSAVQYYELAQDQFKKHHHDHRYYQQFEGNYGRALYQMGQLDKAIPLLIRSVDKDPQGWVFKILIQNALSHGEFSLAANYLDRALSLEKTDINATEQRDILVQISRGFVKNQDNSMAMTYYQRVLALEPGNKEASQYVNSIEKEKSEKDQMDIFDQL